MLIGKDSLKELFALTGNPMPREGPTRRETTIRIDDYTGSDANLDLVKTWLQDCRLNHKKCDASKLRKAQSDLPSRLIDVADQEKPYVLEVEEHLNHNDYLTLSYCWGHGKRLLNTLKSYESFRQALPMDDRMPLTFCEAFRVTRALGYRYIWIDALCILQDDVIDLNKEMTKMGEIYQNSVVTIFAGKGPSVQAGLFAPRDGAAFKPSHVSIQIREHGSDTLEQGEVSFVATPYDFEDPLSTRAWILQEQVLAQRQLIFTPREIRWTCSTQQLSESRPCEDESERGPNKPRVDSSKRTAPTVTLMRSLVASLGLDAVRTGIPPVSRSHFHVWYQTAASYSARKLTVASDKLPAISAIARLIHTHYGCEYGAGLFKEDLSVGLCWTTDRAEADADDYVNSIDEDFEQDYVAPSWSWASLRDAPLVWKGRHDKYSAPEEGIEVLDWQFTYASGAMVPFGKITSGVLTVRGYLRQYLLVPQFGEEKWPRNLRHIWGAYAVDPSTATIVDLVALDTPRLYCDLKKRFEGMECTAEAFKASPSEFLGRALPVSCLVVHVTRHSSHRSVLSLVLVPHGLESDKCHRIGLMMAGSIYPEQWESAITIDARRTIKII